MVLQDTHSCIFWLWIYITLTNTTSPCEKIASQLSPFVAQYIACGIDPNKSTIVIQSHVPQHELDGIEYNDVHGWIKRMTQFRQIKQHQSNINAGLFPYPILMAADILLYQNGSTGWCRSKAAFEIDSRFISV